MPERTLKLTRLHVKYFLRIPAGTRAAAERALSVFERACPLSQTLEGCVRITHEQEIVEEPATGTPAS